MLFWRTNTGLKTVELPQTLMQPFWHPDARHLDDQRFCALLAGDKPLFRLYGVLGLALAILTVSGLALCDLYNSNQYTLLLQQFLQQPLAMQPHTISLLGILAIPLVYIFVKSYPARSICFDRSQHTVIFPFNRLMPKFQESSFQEFQGRMDHLKNLMGKRKTRLLLEHTGSGEVLCLATTYGSPQSLTGYWSFIVQYMSPDAALPDVPELHEYPDTTPGIIHQTTTDYS